MTTPITIPTGDNNRFFDNTTLNDWRECERKGYFRHERNWKREGISPALAYGLSWHSAMDIIWSQAKILEPIKLLAAASEAFVETWVEEGMPDPRTGALDQQQITDLYPRTPGRANDMMVYYMQKYLKYIQEYEILGIEQPFVVPLSETELNLFYIGRLDKIFRAKVNGEVGVSILDHKTTKTEGPSWVNSFSPSAQMDGYAYVGKMIYGDEFKACFIDGALVQKGTPASQKKQTDPDFPAGISFPRFPIQHVPSMLTQWHWEILYFIKSVIDFNADLHSDCKPADDVMRAYPRRTTSCNHYSGCTYKEICSVLTNPMRQIEPPPGFVVEKWQPFDILDITKGPKED